MPGRDRGEEGRVRAAEQGTFQRYGQNCEWKIHSCTKKELFYFVFFKTLIFVDVDFQEEMNFVCFRFVWYLLLHFYLMGVILKIFLICIFGMNN